MLLTQSQVSVVISAAVGYVIQQRTVAGLKQAIQPRIPQPPAAQSVVVDSAIQDIQTSSRFFRRDGSHIAYLDFERARKASMNINWQRLAHVQLVRNHHDVCNSVMLLADLHRLKSPGRRVLLFPQEWASQLVPRKGQPRDPYMESTRRLMRLAARRYGVELLPILPMTTSDDKPAHGITAESDDLFSLASAFQLTDFDRILNIEAPGLLLDASPLDALLAFTEPVPLAMLHDTMDGDGVHSEDILLMKPSVEAHSQLINFAKSMPSWSDNLIASAFSDPLLLDSSTDTSALVRSIGSLHQHDKDVELNRTAFLEDVAYLRFSDPKLPGPEYDVPWTEKVAARPKNKDADWLWTKMYGEFAQKRMEICGLDLETWTG